MQSYQKVTPCTSVLDFCPCSLNDPKARLPSWLARQITQYTYVLKLSKTEPCTVLELCPNSLNVPTDSPLHLLVVHKMAWSCPSSGRRIVKPGVCQRTIIRTSNIKRSVSHTKTFQLVEESLYNLEKTFLQQQISHYKKRLISVYLTLIFGKHLPTHLHTHGWPKLLYLQQKT